MGEVSDQAVINCFHKCDFRKKCPSVQVLDQEEEEFTSLVKEFSSDVSPSDYIDFDHNPQMMYKVKFGYRSLSGKLLNW